MGKKKIQTQSSGRRSSVSVSKEEKTSVNCFTSCVFRVKEMFWRRQHNTKKFVQEMHVEAVSAIFFLPDDILEMCLNRVPLVSLKDARLVCKKWSSLITNPTLIHIRNVGARYKNLWLFVFCTPSYMNLYPLRNSRYCYPNMILALDLYRNQWHNIDAAFLKGRYGFSTASIHDEILIVGGRSERRNNRDIFTTHKEVIFYNAATKSWRNMPSMKYARFLSVLGVTEDPVILHKYSSFVTSRKTYNIRQRRSFLLISVGGFDNNGSLNYGEMYDSLSNEWTEIPRLPLDFGVACAGTFCGSKFYVCSRDEKLAEYDIETGFWIAIQTHLPPFQPNLNTKQLISYDGRLFVISRVFEVWEFDFMYPTWTEISQYIGRKHHQVFASDQNLIFGIDQYMESSREMLSYLSVGDVSKSNIVDWINISTKSLRPKPNYRDFFPHWIRSMEVVHLNI